MNNANDSTPSLALTGNSEAGSGKPAGSAFSYRERLKGKRLLVIGGTGFLGKVWWSFLLHHCPDLGKIYLVVRSKPGLTPEQRFWRDVAASESMAGLRADHGAKLDEFFREKIEVIDGDIVQPYCGIDDACRNALRGKVDAVVNASGIVDFQPPLDVALEVNAFGAQNLVALARDLGDVPMMHTSTCYVAGYRTGIVEEDNPLEHPFPYAGKLERAHWDPDREINECLDIIEQAKHRAGDAFRQSDFLAQAIKNLEERAEPATGRVLDEEIERVRRRFVEVQLAQLGLVRAQFWGWPNTYTYTKSIGEQIVARSGLGFCIVRPAIIESCVSFPQRGWNEGINTSAPLIYAIREGLAQLPGGPIRLDVIPCDMVSAGMTLALAELVAGEAKPVYQFGTSDSNPITMERIYDLSGLYKRKYYQRSRKGSAFMRRVQTHMEGALLSPKAFARFGPKAIAREASRVAGWCENAPEGALNTMLIPVAKNLRTFARGQNKIAEVVLQFQPFTAELDYEFRCDNTRNARARLAPDEQVDMCFTPEAIEWREWFLNIHVAGLERWVFPEIDQRLRKRVKSLKRYESLGQMLQQMARRFELGVALEEMGNEGLTRISYSELYAQASAVAGGLLRRGVTSEARVALSGPRNADWVAAFWGIVSIGAVAVPLAPELSDARRESWLENAGVGWELTTNLRGAGVSGASCVAISTLLQEKQGPVAWPGVSSSQVAVAFSRGALKELSLVSHEELAAGLACLGPLLPLTRTDKVVALGPWQSAAELCAGVLLPLSRGGQVVLPEQAGLESAGQAMAAAHATVVVGSAASVSSWAAELQAQLATSGRFRSLNASRLKLNRSVGRGTGLDVGRFVFSSLHRKLGGYLQRVVSLGGGTAPQAKQFLAALGLPVSDCFTVSDAGAPLAASIGQIGASGKTLGRALPDVQLKISDPDADGFGEVWAQGAVVSRRAQLQGGWLRTGHIGKFDADERLMLRSDASR